MSISDQFRNFFIFKTSVINLKTDISVILFSETLFLLKVLKEIINSVIHTH